MRKNVAKQALIERIEREDIRLLLKGESLAEGGKQWRGLRCGRVGKTIRRGERRYNYRYEREKRRRVCTDERQSYKSVIKDDWNDEKSVGKKEKLETAFEKEEEASRNHLSRLANEITGEGELPTDETKFALSTLHKWQLEGEEGSLVVKIEDTAASPPIKLIE